MRILEAKNLTKIIAGKTIVNNINIEINSGRLVALLGVNGAGKSTTIKMLTGINSPTSGDVEIDGIKPINKSFSHKIGVVFQNSILDADLTVKNNLWTRAKMYKNIDKNYVNSLIEELGLQGILNQKYKTLSGGQRRKVDIVRALVHKPKVLFLDEPSTGLDIQTRSKIWQFINNLKIKYQLTILLTTHYLEETEQSDYVYVISNGKILAADNVSNLKAKYAENTLKVRFKDNSKGIQFLNENAIAYRLVHNKYLLSIPDDVSAIRIISAMQSNVFDFEYQHGTMNDVFLNLTGSRVDEND
ncbi:ABC transporter ATP-binding protein [Apilactobacillus ozensis]|uniref:ABC transporter ATP-binding protein n=1 Tax=Apilactobacillus ozensis TaxID=866801 RepID=UPI00200A7B91|nr:ABC transporter ATP-binding protein [Apilactobacillus ozensis]MCK8607084.1 ABC transporter ATP-binding protein [Apilactobacillus ozensis]